MEKKADGRNFLLVPGVIFTIFGVFNFLGYLIQGWLSYPALYLKQVEITKNFVFNLSVAENLVPLVVYFGFFNSSYSLFCHIMCIVNCNKPEKADFLIKILYGQILIALISVIINLMFYNYNMFMTISSTIALLISIAFTFLFLVGAKKNKRMLEE